MNKMEPKTFPCQISQNWYGSLESAYISITTPKRTHLRIDKWPPKTLKNKWTEDEAAKTLVWKIYNHSIKNNVIELTRDEVFLFKKFSDLQDVDPSERFRKNKWKTFSQRQAEARRESMKHGIRAGICSCGATLNTKDHGTWVGYSCPKCGQGGSYNKNKIKR